MKVTKFQQNTSSKCLPHFKGDVLVEQKSKEQRYVNTENKQEKIKKFNLPVLATTIIGTLIPILLIRKNQKLDFKKGVLNGMNFKTKIKTIFKSFNIKYELEEMLSVSLGSILGGLSGGLLFDKNKDKENKKSKIKESIFQILNVSFPIIIGDQIVKFNTKKNLKGALPKLLAAVIAVGAGMPIAAKVSNTINSKIIDKEHPEKRKIKVKDTFVHLDDFIGVLVLSKIPLVDKLHVEAILPFLYGMCGYEAGTKSNKL